MPGSLLCGYLAWLVCDVASCFGCLLVPELTEMLQFPNSGKQLGRLNAKDPVFLGRFPSFISRRFNKRFSAKKIFEGSESDKTRRSLPSHSVFSSRIFGNHLLKTVSMCFSPHP